MVMFMFTAIRLPLYGQKYQVQTHDLRSSPAQYNFLMLCIYSMQYVKHISTKSSLYLMRYIMLV